MAMVPRHGLGRLNAASTALFVCDIQERFREVIHGFGSLVAATQFLVKSAAVLDVPIVVTEQYPKAFQRTVQDVADLLPPHGSKTFVKTLFSMCTPEVKDHLAGLDVKSVVICGIETHVCVLQTSLDLLDMGYDVHICADAVSSQRVFDRSCALQRLAMVGCHVSTTESLVFQLLGDAKHVQFKTLAPAVKANAVASSVLTKF